jgi:CBS domain containing-hemolysin-like protein
MNIHEANESMLLDLPTGDYDTVAGFVLEVLGDIPTEGEQFSYGSLRFEVEKMKRHRIESVKVTKLRLEAEDGAGQQEADVAEHGWH